MEESTKRRERLKAIRMEASKEDATYNNDHSAVSLSNPLLESATNPEIQMQASQSFSYYTNPMAAYSGNKQRSQVSPQISQTFSSAPPRPWTDERFPAPSLQSHINQSPNPHMQQPHVYHASSNYAYSSNPPPSSNLPNPSWRGNSPYPRGYYGPGQGGYPSLDSSPHFANSPGRGSGRGYPSPGPNFNNGPNHAAQGGYPSHGPSPHFTNSPGHSSGPNFRNSPNHGSSPNQGRGYGLGFGNNMTSGQSSGRGRGRGIGQGGGQGRERYHNHVSAEGRPDRFFNKSMVEDPWKFLEPVVWKSLKKQWYPHSVNAKKPRVSESPKQSSSQRSLAEILAASFNEAAEDKPNAE